MRLRERGALRRAETQKWLNRLKLCKQRAEHKIALNGSGETPAKAEVNKADQRKEERRRRDASHLAVERDRARSMKARTSSYFARFCDQQCLRSSQQIRCG